MYDNVAYMNIGFQRNRPTPLGAWTTATPVEAGARGKREPKKDGMGIVPARGPACTATANVGFPEEFVRKVQKVKDIRGPRFFHALAPCSRGWRYDSEKSIEIARLATDTNVFPLYEIDGGRYRVTRKQGRAKSVSEYLKAHGRFAHMTPDEVASFQAEVDARWKGLLRREAGG